MAVLGNKDIALPFRLAKLFKQSGTDLVHTRNAESFYYGVLGAKLRAKQRPMLALALSYYTWRTLARDAGLKQADAVKAMMEDGIKPDKVSEKVLARYLYDPQMPDPDLMIRTSGEHRISNFLLWELAYSELIFVDVLWPDFRREHLFDAVREFQNRDRRFGGVDT